MSHVGHSPAFDSAPPRLATAVVEQLSRLGARLYERPAQTEIIEIPEGFFLLPAALRQLLFDVVWPRNSQLQSTTCDHLWHARWFPVAQQTRLRHWPLVLLADSSSRIEQLSRPETHLALIRLDDPRPQDPRVYVLDPRAEPSEVLGEPSTEAAPGDDGDRLSRWLEGLVSAPATPAVPPDSATAP